MSSDSGARVRQTGIGGMAGGSTDPIRIVIADDHAVLREALASYVDAQADMNIVGQAGSGAEARERAQELKPDVLVVDISMPGENGIQTIEKLSAECPEVRCLVLTMHEDHQFLRSALAAGGAGYLTKRAASGELLSAIRQVAQGRSYINIKLEQVGLAEVVQRESPPSESNQVPLSPREREVLSMVAQGYTSKEVARQLGISSASVDTYRLRITEKLQANHRADLVRYALRNGLLEKEYPGD